MNDFKFEGFVVQFGLSFDFDIPKPIQIVVDYYEHPYVGLGNILNG